MSDSYGIREIGNRLNIPPSTVVYYRDRFRDHIPTVATRGRHPRYAADSLAVFRRIRKRFQDGWSAEAISAELSERWGRSDQSASAATLSETSTTIPRQLSRVAAALEQVAADNTIKDDSHRDIRQVKEELRLWCGDRDARLDLLEKRVGGLEPDAEAAVSVMAELLALPLAVAIPPDRFVGIRDAAGQSVTLDRFMALIEANAPGRQTVNYQWTGQGTRWQMRATLIYPGASIPRRIEAEVEGRDTPRGNRVAVIHRMSIDARPLRRQDLLEMLKGIKQALAQWETESG